MRNENNKQKSQRTKTSRRPSRHNHTNETVDDIISFVFYYSVDVLLWELNVLCLLRVFHLSLLTTKKFLQLTAKF